MIQFHQKASARNTKHKIFLVGKVIIKIYNTVDVHVFAHVHLHISLLPWFPRIETSRFQTEFLSFVSSLRDLEIQNFLKKVCLSTDKVILGFNIQFFSFSTRTEKVCVAVVAAKNTPLKFSLMIRNNRPLHQRACRKRRVVTTILQATIAMTGYKWAIKESAPLKTTAESEQREEHKS